ncbi:MAG TPA: hypothetical protein VJU14_03225 [Solirubrobacterales bacterium]|nr:hypothetical protein [Solirubrobacterales bacterium]
MQDLTVRQLLDLTTAEVPDAPQHLQKAFEWHFERSMTGVKLLFGVAGSLLLAVTAAAFKEQIEVEWWQLTIIGASALAFAGMGVWRFQAARVVYRQYFAALQLLRELEDLAPLLRLYQSTYVQSPAAVKGRRP